MPGIFVVSHRGPYYFTMHHDDAHKHPTLLYLSDKDIVFKDFSTAASCVSALFLNNIEQIHNLCSFTLQQNFVQPNVLFLSNGKILLSNISAITLHCNGQHTNLPGCIQCVRSLPCNCGVKVFLQNSSLPSLFWSPRLVGCSRSVNVSKTRYIVNLASLQSLFHDDSLGDLDNPLTVRMPIFRHFHHKFHELLSKDIERSHDSRKFATRVRNQSLIFNDLSDVVLNNMHEILSSDTNDQEFLLTSQVTTFSWWITWSSVLCSYVSLVLALYLLYKFKFTGSLLPLLKSAAASQSTFFPSYLNFGGI